MPQVLAKRDVLGADIFGRDVARLCGRTWLCPAGLPLIQRAIQRARTTFQDVDVHEASLVAVLGQEVDRVADVNGDAAFYERRRVLSGEIKSEARGEGLVGHISFASSLLPMRIVFH